MRQVGNGTVTGPGPGPGTGHGSGVRACGWWCALWVSVHGGGILMRNERGFDLRHVDLRYVDQLYRLFRV